MAQMVISKSEFMLFLKHPAWLWLKKFDKDKLPLPDAELQALFDEGTLFESYAEKLFPDATKLGYKNGNDFSGTKYYGLPEATQKELDKNTEVILQGRLEVEAPRGTSGNITSIFDVLERTGPNSFNLYEIKSSTSVKPEHIPDLAFQTIVLEKAGLKIEGIYVLHVNNKYVRQGEIDPREITVKSEVTEDVRGRIEQTLEEINKAFGVLSKKEMPDPSPRFLSAGGDVFSEWMTVLKAIKGEFPRYHIYNLCRPDPDTIAWLEDNGIESLGEVPLDGPLNQAQLKQVEAIRSGTQHIDKEEIKNFLSSLEYPLYFLDYETLAGVIPFFDGYRPYQQVPFQYSLHVLDKPEGKLEHKEYLHTENTDPVLALLTNLREHVGERGTVISWYMTFEKNRNAEMAKLHPQYEAFLLGINERMVDLMTPFSKGWFVDKDFFGRASIKWVLPALLPELSYKSLNISNGGQAQRVWIETVLKGMHQARKKEIMEDLRKYCNLDTYAMYAIYDYLTRVV